MARTGFSLLVLTSCVFVGTFVYSEVASAQRYHSPAMARLRYLAPPPVAPDHGHRHFYRGGVQLVFDAHSVIGGNVWLTQSVPPYTRVTIDSPSLQLHQKPPKHLGEGI